MITLGFFNNKGGVGKTSLVAHLSWMFAERGVSLLAVDLDPQSNLSSMFLDEDQLTESVEQGETVYAAIEPQMDRSGDLGQVYVKSIEDDLHLLVGDLRLSRAEDLFADNWSKTPLGKDVGAFKVMSLFHRAIARAANDVNASLVLVDLGPNLGPLNRAALLSCTHIIIPIAPDLFSLQGLRNLGPTLDEWKSEWQSAKSRFGPNKGTVDIPAGEMTPIGYVTMNFGARDNKPVAAFQKWADQIPGVFKAEVLRSEQAKDESFQLAELKNYRSLMPMAQSAHKPMFRLKTADGARGAHLEAVQQCHKDFLNLARRIGEKLGVEVP